MAGKSHRSRPWHDQLGLVIEGRQPTMMVNQEGSRTTPSVVAFAKDGQRLARWSITLTSRAHDDMKAIAGILLVTTVAAASDFSPARRVGGVSPPLPPPTVVGWLEEVVGLAVDVSGVVSTVKVLRATTNPPNLLGAAAATWRFRPAAVGGRPVSSHVLAVALIRPPQLFDAPTPGAEPTTFAAAPDDLPAPTVMHRPRYPPLAVGDSLVLVEVLVGPDGHVRAADIAEGTTAVFNDEALFTARNWVFRPAHHNGEPVAVYAYIAFGFRQPIRGHGN